MNGSAYEPGAFGGPLLESTPELRVGRWSLLSRQPFVLTYGVVSYVSVSWRFCPCRCRPALAPPLRY